MVVHPPSHRVSRVRRYSGYSLSVFSFAYGTLTLCGRLSHTVQLDTSDHDASPNPEDPERPSVWPPPRSLATTSGISVDVFSSPYLDVSVQAVPFLHLWIQYRMTGLAPSRVSPFGYPRVIVCFRLTVAFRRSLRPSSALSAKASPLRSS